MRGSCTWGFDCNKYIRDLTKTTTTTATGTSKNNRFNEQNKNCACASRFFVRCFAFTAQLRREMTKL